MPNTGEIFWSRFVEDKDKYEHFASLSPEAREHLLDDLTYTLHEYSDGLYFEMSDQKPFELIITAQGIAEYFGPAEYLVMQAPPIDGWKITALKPAISGGSTVEVNGVKIRAEDCSFTSTTDEDSAEAIAIRLIHPSIPAEGYNDELRSDLITGIYAILDALLGERSVTLDIELIEYSSQASPDDEPKPLSELTGYIRKKKKERSNFEIRFPERSYAAFEGEVDGFLKRLVADIALNYYSFKHDYPYLSIMELGFDEVDENGMPSEEEINEIQELEASVADYIRSAGLGHHCLSETGNSKREIWFYLKDDDESVDAILNQSGNMGDRVFSYLSMYDPYWVKVSEFIK